MRAACPPNQPLSPHAPSEQERRRLWTAVSHHSSRGARSAPARPPYQPLSQQAPSEQAAAGSGLLSELQLSLRTECVCEPLRSSPAEGPWTAEACCRFPGASPLARHQSSHPSIHPSPNQPFSPLRQPTLPTRPLPIKPPSEHAAAGSGLLSELQLSPRTECAYPPSPQAPGSAEPQLGVLRTRPFRTRAPQALDCWENHSSPCARSAPTCPPHKPLGALSPSSAFSVLAPSVQASRRLWPAGRITALSAHGVRLPTLPTSPWER